VDPLEILFVRDAMRTNVVALAADSTVSEVHASKRPHHGPHGQLLFPVVDEAKRLRGVITRTQLFKTMQDGLARNKKLAEVASDAAVAHPDEPLRVVVNRMAETGLTRFPVVDRSDERRLLGIISLRDLLSARTRNLEEERSRERVLRIRLPVLSRPGARTEL